MNDTSAEALVRELQLAPHPEGGYFRETHREPNPAGGRDHSTTIYYLLAAGDVSAWHRVDATEVWHWYAGGPLALTLSPDGHDAAAHRLGPNILAGERPQVIIQPHVWQTAESLGHWTLVGCTVSPGFCFDGFELAPPDWRPVPRDPRG